MPSSRRSNHATAWVNLAHVAALGTTIVDGATGRRLHVRNQLHPGRRLSGPVNATIGRTADGDIAIGLSELAQNGAFEMYQP